MGKDNLEDVLRYNQNTMSENIKSKLKAFQVANVSISRAITELDNKLSDSVQNFVSLIKILNIKKSTRNCNLISYIYSSII